MSTAATLRCSLCKTLKSTRDFSEAQIRKGGPDAICMECLAPNRNFWQRWLPTILGVVFLSTLGAALLCQSSIPKLNVSSVSSLLDTNAIRQKFEDVDEWRKSIMNEIYKDVNESELAKATRWIKHADPFSLHRSCSPFLNIFQDSRIQSLLDNLREVTWSPQEMKELIANYAYHTTGLDGNNLTQPETLEVVEHKKCEHCDKDKGDSILEVKNIEHILSTYPLFTFDTKSEPVDITTQTLIDLNSAILSDLDVSLGLRRHQDVIGKKKVLVPKPEELKHLVEEYVKWLKEQVDKLKPDDINGAMQLACDAHTRFLHIHPFSDGNGRLARLLSAFVLRRVGLPAPMIKRELRDQYSDAVVEATMNGKYKKICQLFYDGVRETLNQQSSLVSKRKS